MLNIVPSNSRIEYMFRFFEEMPEKELRAELNRSALGQAGSRKQMIKRLRDHYRQGLVDLRRTLNYRTENIYDYFIAIDFECTCEQGEYKYDHEIIEFPAVLISVRSRKIIDSFRTLIRPKDNAVLTKFCTELTGIKQEDVDRAPSFPEALSMFRGWMSKHGLDGIGNRGSCRRFCYVTDGPWDIVKFLQAECIRWAMPLPHDFRAFLNLRRAFINFYCHYSSRAGNPSGGGRLPDANLKEMLNRLELTFEGHEHCGMDDTGNIANILVRMLADGAELRVNEKLVNGSRLLPWHLNQLVFTDKHWDNKGGQKQQQQPSSSSSSITATLTLTAADEEENGGEERTVNGGGDVGPEQQQQHEQKHKWWELLPYKLVKIRREQFLGELFLECESCDEREEEEEEAPDGGVGVVNGGE